MDRAPASAPSNPVSAIVRGTSASAAHPTNNTATNATLERLFTNRMVGRPAAEHACFSQGDDQPSEQIANRPTHNGPGTPPPSPHPQPTHNGPAADPPRLDLTWVRVP
ncbi:hypothetical protein GCM10027184_28460 [Saccharothrix stipae]